MFRVPRFSHALILLVMVALPAATLAQAYPTRPIRLILPFAAGGPTDLLGRAISQKLGEQLGQTVMADNRTGAGGNLGAELTAKSPPDGYTLVLTSPFVAISPALYAKLNYDAAKDLAPISLVALIQNVLVVHPSVPAKTLKEFIQLARAYPGKLNFGSGGVGATSHLAPELLKSLARLDMVHVPYKGTGQAVVGLISGQIDMLIMAAPAIAPHIQDRKVRALAVLSEKRTTPLPDVPTAKEAGLDNFEVGLWFGMFAAAGTPRDIINRLNLGLHKALAAPDLKERLATIGVEPMTSTPEEFADFLRSETARYARLIKDAGIKTN
ncbi:MAG: tripartite tricarboxylate transporter substrate binding protein [Burkholderiales bacterium]|nr:tripartite tricarboxylate transporter substrate binding protein [Burkholderiales bacterium]